MERIRLIAGIDIGNGYMKGAISADGGTPTPVDFPSCVSINTTDSGVKAGLADAGREIGDIYNQMDASFDSPAVKSKVARLFGQRGVQSGKSVEEFDMAAIVPKAKQDLCGVLLLGSLAGKALQAYWDKNHELPLDVLPVDVRVAVALPIAEYKKLRKEYVGCLKGAPHMVSIHNFETPVRVEIRFEDVQVLAEGAAAQFAILHQGPELMQEMLDDMERYGLPKNGLTGADVMQATDSVGIDIGEGTVNFPVFTNGRFNPDASKSFGKGYGSVLERAQEKLQDEGFSYGSRKSLSEFLLTKPNAMTRGRYNHVMSVVDQEIGGFVQEVLQQFRAVIDRVGAYVQVVYIYGGGAVPVKEQFYRTVIDVSKGAGGPDTSYPVLYMVPDMTRSLNRDGLFIVASQCAQQAAQQAAKAKKA